MFDSLRKGLSWRSSILASVLALVATIWQCQPLEDVGQQQQRGAIGTAVFKHWGPDEVFSFVTNPATVNEWLPMVKYIQSRSGGGVPDAVGNEVTVVFETGYGTSRYLRLFNLPQFYFSLLRDGRCFRWDPMYFPQ